MLVDVFVILRELAENSLSSTTKAPELVMSWNKIRMCRWDGDLQYINDSIFTFESLFNSYLALALNIH